MQKPQMELHGVSSQIQLLESQISGMEILSDKPTWWEEPDRKVETQIYSKHQQASSLLEWAQNQVYVIIWSRRAKDHFEDYVCAI